MLVVDHLKNCKPNNCSLCSKVKMRLVKIKRRKRLWRKLKCYLKFVTFMICAQARAAEKIYAPGGFGARRAADNFAVISTKNIAWTVKIFVYPLDSICFVTRAANTHTHTRNARTHGKWRTQTRTVCRPWFSICLRKCEPNFLPTSCFRRRKRLSMLRQYSLP